MKKLRVYFKSSILHNYRYYDVKTPEEGKRLIEALDGTIGNIIKTNSMTPYGSYSHGLEEFNTDDNEWQEWLHPEIGCHIDEVDNYVTA